MKWSSEALERLSVYAERKMPASEMAKEFQVSRARIYQVLQQYDIDTPKRRRTQESLSPEEYRVWRNISAIRSREKQKGNDITIDIEDFLPLPTYCPILGIELFYGYRKRGCYEDDSPSIDRVDSSKGYTKENTVILSWRANRIKNDGTAEEHSKISTFMKDY